MSLAGFFPTSVTFRGSFRYPDGDALEASIGAVEELLEGEDDELAGDLELKRRGYELRVRVDTTCARDEYLAYEALIEALATRAVDGEVVGEIDDTITTYTAARPAAPTVAARAAGAVMWIPVLAHDWVVLP